MILINPVETHYNPSLKEGILLMDNMIKIMVRTCFLNNSINLVRIIKYIKNYNLNIIFMQL